MNTIEALEAARQARSQQSWRLAAILFTEAADTLATDPHGGVTADERSHRRDAYLCLNRTREFFKFREKARARDRHAEFREDWRLPTGDFVRQVLGSERTVS